MKYVVVVCLIVGASAGSVLVGQWWPELSRAFALGIGFATGYYAAVKQADRHRAQR